MDGKDPVNKPDMEYDFVKETVKSSKHRVRRFLLKILCALMLGLIAGTAASFAFLIITNDARTNAGNVIIKPDATPTPEPTSTPKPSVTVAATGTPAPLVPEDDPEALLEKVDELRNAWNERIKGLVVGMAGSIVEVKGVHEKSDTVTRLGSKTSRNGLIIAENWRYYYIVTEYEAVKGFEQIAVTFRDGSTHPGMLAKGDSVTGLCVVKVSSGWLSDRTKEMIAPAELGNSNILRTGETVISMGGMFGYTDAFDSGEITNVADIRAVVDDEFPLLRTNISSPAGDGGVLLNKDGEVIGLITERFNDEAGVLTALPISKLKRLLEVLSNELPVPYLGITGQSVTETMSEYSNVPVGVFVESVEVNSPALEGALLPGDVIKSIDGLTVVSMDQIHNFLITKKPGDDIKIQVLRQGADGYVPRECLVTLGETGD